MASVTNNVQEKPLSTVKCLDIHDADRKKIAITIRPRCREYALRQRSIRTLACLVNESKGVDDSSDEAEPEEDAPKVTLTPIKTKEMWKPKPQKKKMPKAPRAMVLSGRVEKPARKESPKPPADAPFAPLFSCGCSTPSDCMHCSLQRLADKFAAVVNARAERLRQDAEERALFT